jgi:hypothetical protein
MSLSGQPSGAGQRANRLDLVDVGRVGSTTERQWARGTKLRGAVHHERLAVSHPRARIANRHSEPITAIRHPDDGNPATDTDASWTPLFSAGFPTSPPLPGLPDPLPIGGVGGPLSTPPYPEHPSGATAYASASMHALASFFGTDEMTFYATSGRYPGEQRTFNRFSDLTNEVLEARIWAGIHFRTAVVQAADLGREVEQFVHTHQFAFVH